MTINCQDCGRIIYWDNNMRDPVESVDDFSAPPYVTESGDLFCNVCGPRYDEADEEDKFEEFYGDAEEKASSEVKQT